MSRWVRLDPTIRHPANGRNRRILPTPVGAGERPLTEPTAAARPWRREPLTLRTNARHRARIGIRGGEQLVLPFQIKLVIFSSLHHERWGSSRSASIFAR